MVSVKLLYQHCDDWLFLALCLGSGVDCEANGSAGFQEHGSVEASCGEHASRRHIPSSNHTDASYPAGEVFFLENITTGAGEVIHPCHVKRFECPENRYINVTNYSSLINVTLLKCVSL